jgi:cysteine synthase
MNRHFTRHGVDPLPPLARLDPAYPNLWAVPFPLMKLLPAQFILSRGVSDGAIGRSTAVIESSSGNIAMGLALECHSRGLKLYVVGDPAISPQWRARMRQLGVRVLIVKRPDELGSYQRPRLRMVERVREKHADHFLTSQYHNLNNSMAYADLAESVVDAIGQVDALFGAVGSGGSVCGTGTFLRSLFPHLHIAAVDTPNSVLFGQKDGHRSLRGLGNSIVPKNLRHDLIDEVHWVSAAVAYRATRELYSRHRLFQGGTSGAAYLTARWYAERHPDAKVVAILPDDGNRYADTIYSRTWLQQNGLWLDSLPAEPTTVSAPLLALGPWNRFEWQRRQLAVVTGKPGENEAAQ